VKIALAATCSCHDLYGIIFDANRDLAKFRTFFCLFCWSHLASRLLQIFFFMSSRLLASLSLPMAIFLLNAEQERSKAKKRRSIPFIRTGASFDHETYPASLFRSNMRFEKSDILQLCALLAYLTHLPWTMDP
jgi:hypothetical protein